MSPSVCDESAVMSTHKGSTCMRSGRFAAFGGLLHLGTHSRSVPDLLLPNQLPLHQSEAVVTCHQCHGLCCRYVVHPSAYMVHRPHPDSAAKKQFDADIAEVQRPAARHF